MNGASLLPPLPAPPPELDCPTFDGHAIDWLPWKTDLRATHGVSACDCGHDPRWIRSGLLVPNPGETQLVPRRSVHPKARGWDNIEVPARPVLRLSASYCPACRDVAILETTSDPGFMPVPMILCDHCDALAAFGSTFEEARQNLVLLGGWTAGDDADWDLCPTCSPVDRSRDNVRVLRRRGVSAAG